MVSLMKRVVSKSWLHEQVNTDDQQRRHHWDDEIAQQVEEQRRLFERRAETRHAEYRRQLAEWKARKKQVRF